MIIFFVNSCNFFRCVYNIQYILFTNILGVFLIAVSIKKIKVAVFSEKNAYIYVGASSNKADTFM